MTAWKQKSEKNITANENFGAYENHDLGCMTMRTSLDNSFRLRL